MRVVSIKTDSGTAMGKGKKPEKKKKKKTQYSNVQEKYEGQMDRVLSGKLVS